MYRYGEGVYSQVRGWPNGWFGEGDYTNYVQNYQRRTRDKYIDVEEEFTVRAGYEDIWVAFECQSNDPKYNGGDLNRGYWRNETGIGVGERDETIILLLAVTYCMCVHRRKGA